MYIKARRVIYHAIDPVRTFESMCGLDLLGLQDKWNILQHWIKHDYRHARCEKCLRHPKVILALLANIE
jgi:hypothetical protein